MDSAERQQFTTALAAFDALRAAGYPRELAEDLSRSHEGLKRVVRAARRASGGFWNGLRDVWTGIWELLGLLTGEVSVGARPAAVLREELRRLAGQAEELKAVIAALPGFATAARCAADAGDPERATTDAYAAGLADYLLCVAQSLRPGGSAQ